MYPLTAAIVLDVDGIVLPSSGDAPMPRPSARSLADLRDAGVAVAFIAKERELHRYVPAARARPPLSHLGGGAAIDAPLSRVRKQTGPGQLHGRRALAGSPQGGTHPPARLGYIQPHRLRVCAPSSRRRADVVLRGTVRHVLARFAADDPVRLVVMGNSLQRAGSDVPILRVAPGALTVQVRHAAPLPSVLHLSVGLWATWVVLRTLPGLAAEGRHALTRAAAALQP
jgi:hypothetical protein